MLLLHSNSPFGLSINAQANGAIHEVPLVEELVCHRPQTQVSTEREGRVPNRDDSPREQRTGNELPLHTWRPVMGPGKAPEGIVYS